jgi:hypothetical protein
MKLPGFQPSLREGRKPGGFMNPRGNLEENSYYSFDNK